MLENESQTVEGGSTKYTVYRQFRHDIYQVTSIYTAGVRVWQVKAENGHPEIYLHPRV